jgi:hypothetical protein
MRKYENVDVVACLGAVMEINTENYKSDFKYDVGMFYDAARKPDGENNRLLWLTRRSGTECFFERDVYLMPSQAYETWQSYAASRYEAARAYAVEITALDSGRVYGDIYELDYRDHAADVKRAARPVYTVDTLYADGERLHLPYKIWDANRERLYHEHGHLQSVRRIPDDEDALQKVLNTARARREKECRSSVFKVAIQHDRQPSIRSQLAEGRKQIARQRSAVPQKATARSHDMEM